MSEAFNDFGPVEWFRNQFVDASAASLFRLVLVSWLVLAIVLIATDRLGTLLLGRSRPLAQQPPVRARAWRWGSRTPPENYSLLPPGVLDVPRVETARVVNRPLALPAAFSTADLADSALSTEGDSWDLLDDVDFWQLHASDDRPLFGFENASRLRKGGPPERYNPVTGRAEALVRDGEDRSISWPPITRSVFVLGSEDQ